MFCAGFRTHFLSRSERTTYKIAASMATAEKVYIIGIGDDGLEGVTSLARQLIERASLLIGPASLLGRVPAGRGRTARRGGRSGRAFAAHLGGPRPGGGPRLGRSALLWRRPLSLRQARQGPLRGRAARQQHAVGLRPREGELGRRLSDEPGQPPAGERAREDPRGREGGPVHHASEHSPAAVARALLDRRIDYFSRLRLREPRLARRARDAGRAGRAGRAGLRAAERDDPGPQAERARPAQRGHRPPAVRQSRRGVPAIEAQARPAHAGRSARDRPGPAGPRAATASCGTSAPAAAVSPSRRRRSPATARPTPSKWMPTTTS